MVSNGVFATVLIIIGIAHVAIGASKNDFWDGVMGALQFTCGAILLTVNILEAIKTK